MTERSLNRRSRDRDTLAFGARSGAAGRAAVGWLGTALGLGIAIGGVMTHPRASALAAGPELGVAEPDVVAAAQSVSTAFERVSAKIAPSVVRIESLNRVGTSLVPGGQGSGVVIDEDEGFIVTNAHVVRNSDVRRIVFVDGRRENAQLVGVDVDTDLALLRVDATDLVAAPLRTDEDARVGEWVIAVGNPFGLGHAVTAGIVSGRGRQQGQSIATYEDFIQTDAAINPGNSGGPLVDLKGRVMGINTAIVDTRLGGQGIGFAIPANMVADVAEELAANGRVTRGYLGVNLDRLSSAYVDRVSYDGSSRVRVGSVVDNSPADVAGLRQGDILHAIDGNPVTSLEVLMKRIARLRPGTEVDVEVVRDGSKRRLPVRLTQRPEFAARR